MNWLTRLIGMRSRIAPTERRRSTQLCVEELESRWVPSAVLHAAGSHAATSSNWSGYDVTANAGAVTSVRGSWTVPSVSGIGSSTSSAWVGIDGANSSSVEQIGTDVYWWGGNLEGAELKRVELDVPNRVVYATHEYPKAVFDQPWFSAETNYFEKLPPVWDQYWGYLVAKDIAPVWIAEFGTADELPWLQQILDYATSRGIHFAYRAFNPNTDSRIGGILETDCTTVNQDKQARLAPALAPIIP